MISAERARKALSLCAPLGALCTLSVISSAGAAAPSVTGKVVNANHYTLLALAPNGQSTPVVLNSSGSFDVAARRGWTLQLLAPDSRYFGPIVLSYKGTRGWEALSGQSVQLGTITLHRGYAAPTRQASASATQTSNWFHTNASGAPIGAGNLGLIPATAPARHHRAVARMAEVPTPGPGSSQGAGSPAAGGSTLAAGEDPSQVGIPTAFNADPTGSGEPSQENAQASSEGAGGDLFTAVGSPIAGSVNVDAEAVTTAEMTQFIADDLGLAFTPQDPTLGAISSVSVDCGALTYCATATVGAVAGTVLAHGSLWNGQVPSGNSPGSFQISLQLHTTPSEIQPGDVYQIQYATPSGTVTVPATLTLYFATVPAVSSIGEGTGAAAAASPQTITYPANATTYGSPQNPVMLTGDSINLSFWRPQRAAFPGETGPYVDMGHLHYGASIAVANGSGNCPASDYSDLSPTLDAAPPSGDSMYDAAYPLIDSAADAAPSSANELGFTVNLDDCLAANGQATTGQEIVLGLAAADDSRDGSSDSGEQSIYVCLPGCTVGDVVGPGGNAGPGGNPAPGDNAGAGGNPAPGDNAGAGGNPAPGDNAGAGGNAGASGTSGPSGSVGPGSAGSP